MFYGSEEDNQRYIDLMEGIKLLYSQSVTKPQNKHKLPFITKRVKTSQVYPVYCKREDCNYFLDERIAVYTCIIGAYDYLREPLFVPDNCDFYVITDQEVPTSSKWKKLDMNQYLDQSKQWNSTLINRYFKMNPHKIFSEYSYSLYVDGNIEIYTDMTEHINRISSHGVGFFVHGERDCVYQEIDKCIELHKDSYERLNEQRNYFQSQGMPEHYGLLAANIIARKHHDERCIAIMEEWWNVFSKGFKRDQVVLPYVLYRQGIMPHEVGTLGKDYREDCSFKRLKHLS